MSSKRSPPSKAVGTEPKRRRKMLTVAEKVRLLDMIKEGKSCSAVGRHYGINESTIRHIKKEEKNIRATAALFFNQQAKRLITQQNKTIVTMESALGCWINDCIKTNVPLTTNIICEKARQLHAKFAKEEEEADADDIDDPQPGPSTGSPKKKKAGFNASKGWFEKFKKRFYLRSMPQQGETISTDKIAAVEYVNETFRTIIEEGGYKPEQVFNMDETGLFWKRLPSRTFIMKEEAAASGFKASKDRVTLIICGNAAGYMVKPGLIYKCKNPRALKNKNKNQLPVYWMHNPKAWITKFLASDWFHQCFIPEVKLYLAEKGLEFKVLLLMDNSGGHALDPTYDSVQIEFLPSNITSLIQPMDQGVIRVFKALYTQNALSHLHEAMDADEDFSLKACWREYTITTCLGNIEKAIGEMKQETLNACWKKLWPEVVHNYKGLSPAEIHNGAVDKAVKVAKSLGGDGFDDMTGDDVNGLIDAHSASLTDEELTEMTKAASEEEEEEKQDAEHEEEVGLTLERLGTMVRMARELQAVAERWDPHLVRALQFNNAINGAIEIYKNVRTQIKKQRQQLPTTMGIISLQNKDSPSAEAEVPDDDEDDDGFTSPLELAPS